MVQEPECSSLHSQHLAAGPYPEPVMCLLLSFTHTTDTYL